MNIIINSFERHTNSEDSHRFPYPLVFVVGWAP